MAYKSVKNAASSADIADIVKSINKASDRELKAIAEISSYLHDNGGDITSPKGELVGSKGVSSVASGEVAKDNSTDRIIDKLNEVKKEVKKAGVGDITSLTATNKGSENKQPIAVTSQKTTAINRMAGLQAISKKVESTTKTHTEKLVGEVSKITDKSVAIKSHDLATNSADQTAVNSADKSATIDRIGNRESTSTKLIAVSDPEQDKFAKYWKDEKGRLRKSNGQYASKTESAEYSKSTQAKKENDADKNTGLLGKLVSFASKSAGIKNGSFYSSNRGAVSGAVNSTTTNMVGGALGGEYFYIAKEIFNVANDAKHAIDFSTKKLGEFKNKRAEKKALKLQKKQLKLVTKQEQQEKDEWPKSAAGSVVAKEQSFKRDSLEAIKEQTAEDKKFHTDLLKAMDDMTTNIGKAGADGGGGIIDSIIGDLVGDVAAGTGVGATIKKLKDKLTGKSKGSAKVKAEEKVKGKGGVKESRTRSVSEKVSKSSATEKASKITSVEEAATKNVAKKSGTFSKIFSAVKGESSKIGKVPFIDKIAKSPVTSRIGSFAEDTGGLLKGAGKGLLKKLPIVGALLSGGLKANELKDRDDLSTTQKGVQVSSHVAGGWAGAAAGAAGGAAIGSVVPIFGTAIGGLIGGVLGGMGGEKVGDALGAGLSSFVGKDSTISKTMSDAGDLAKDKITEGADALKDAVNGLSSFFGGGAVFDNKNTSNTSTSNSTHSSTTSVATNKADYVKNDKTDQRVSQYQSKIDKYADQYHVPKLAMKMLVRQESGGNANAKSGVGAGGLTQMMPSTAKDLGVSNVYDPDQSLKGGSKYMGQLMKKYKGKGYDEDNALKLALSSYNAGSGWVDAAIKKSGDTSGNSDAVLKAMEDPSLTIKSHGKDIHRSKASIKQSKEYVEKIYSNYDKARQEENGTTNNTKSVVPVAPVAPIVGKKVTAVDTKSNTTKSTSNTTTSNKVSNSNSDTNTANSSTKAINGTNTANSSIMSSEHVVPVKSVVPAKTAITTNKSIKEIKQDKTVSKNLKNGALNVNTDKQKPVKLSPSLKNVNNKSNPAAKGQDVIKSEFDSDYLRMMTLDLN